MSGTYKGVGGGGRWAARDEFCLLLGLLGLAMSIKSASHRPKHAYRAYETSYYHWDQFWNHAFHVVPSMGYIV